MTWRQCLKSETTYAILLIQNSVSVLTYRTKRNKYFRMNGLFSWKSLCKTSNLNTGSINVKFCITFLFVLTSVTTCIMCSISIGKCSTVIYESAGNSLTQKSKIIFVRNSFCTFFMSQLKVVLWEAFMWNPLSVYNALPMCSTSFYQTISFISLYSGCCFVVVCLFCSPPKKKIANLDCLTYSSVYYI